MVHKLFGFLLLLLLLSLVLLATPSHCARGRFGLHHFHHHAHPHPHLHQLHSSNARRVANNIVNIHMVTEKEAKSSSDPTSFMWVPGHSASMDKVVVSDGSITEFGHSASMDNVHMGDGSITAFGMRTQEADSMDTMNIPSSPSTSKPSTSVHVSNSIANKRTLLDPNEALQGEEDLNLLLATFTTQRDDNLFGMLPRAHRVPPSGPSKSHNSALTDKPS